MNYDINVRPFVVRKHIYDHKAKGFSESSANTEYDNLMVVTCTAVMPKHPDAEYAESVDVLKVVTPGSEVSSVVAMAMGVVLIMEASEYTHIPTREVEAGTETGVHQS